jgi:ribonuclease P protein 3
MDREMALAIIAEADRHHIEIDRDDVASLLALFTSLGEPIATFFGLIEKIQEYVTDLSTEGGSTAMKWLRSGGIDCRIVDIHRDLGHCPYCHTPFQGFPFTSEFKQTLLGDIDRLVVAQRDRDSRKAHAIGVCFESWKRFIGSNQGVKLFIDGANLGYYDVSSWYGYAKVQHLKEQGLASDLPAESLHLGKRAYVDVPISFNLIDLAVSESLSRRMRPLVLLHKRHTETKNVLHADHGVLARLQRSGYIYAAPPGLNDDILWLYGALQLTTPTTSSGPSSETVYVLTNDKMRDHHFKLLSPRAFTRWRDQHRIGFTCARSEHRAQLTWQMPKSYAQCIQRDPSFWHIPVCGDDGDEPGCESHQWLCVPTSGNQTPAT